MTKLIGVVTRNLHQTGANLLSANYAPACPHPNPHSQPPVTLTNPNTLSSQPLLCNLLAETQENLVSNMHVLFFFFKYACPYATVSPPVYTAGALRDAILAKWIRLEMIPGNRTDQFGYKPKAPSLRAWLLPLCWDAMDGTSGVRLGHRISLN